MNNIIVEDLYKQLNQRSKIKDEYPCIETIPLATAQPKVRLHNLTSELADSFNALNPKGIIIGFVNYKDKKLLIILNFATPTYDIYDFNFDTNVCTLYKRITLPSSFSKNSLFLMCYNDVDTFCIYDGLTSICTFTLEGESTTCTQLPTPEDMVKNKYIFVYDGVDLYAMDSVNKLAHAYNSNDNTWSDVIDLSLPNILLGDPEGHEDKSKLKLYPSTIHKEEDGSYIVLYKGNFYFYKYKISHNNNTHSAYFYYKTPAINGLNSIVQYNQKISYVRTFTDGSSLVYYYYDYINDKHYKFNDVLLYDYITESQPLGDNQPVLWGAYKTTADGIHLYYGYLMEFIF